MLSTAQHDQESGMAPQSQAQPQPQAQSTGIAAPKSFGTNSPPLEATGSARPMGMASVDGDVDTGYVEDAVQRRAYFSGEADDMNMKAQGAGGDVEREERRGRRMEKEKMGQSMAAKMDERS